MKNTTPTIISSNCNGEYWYYDMNLKFLSPTINLSFDMNDYVKMLENLPWYMKQPVLPYEDRRFEFPTGRIGDIEIRFNHYKTFMEAEYKWEERKKGSTGTIFDKLPYKNKVIFTHVPYDEIKSAYYIPGFENCEGLEALLYFKKQMRIRRYLDDFDYISFLNGKGF